MRNLKLQKHKLNVFPEIKSPDKITLSNDDEDTIYISHNLKIYKLNTANNEVLLLLDICEEIPLPDIHVVNLVYLSIQSSLCVALNVGSIFVINLLSLDVWHPTLHHACEDGIKAMQLSPDQELVTIVTNSNFVFQLDCNLSLINDANLNDGGFGEGEFITVGWGKKETQFHGSEGKEAAKVKTVIDENGGDNVEDKSVITWRGDGSLFAVGYRLNSVYIFKVFDRECVLLYTSEKQPGIECNFAWKPTGELIATTQQYPNKYVVAFFEKNGLKHGEFVLPFKKSDIIVQNLSWSSDATALSVWCLNLVTQETSILIYTVNNYHWYLKQSLEFSKEKKLLALRWDDSASVNKGKSLHLFSESGIYSQYVWVWCTNQSSGKNEQDNAVVGVIDGEKVLLTCFRKAVVPPPMSSATIQCDKNINHIAFAPPIQVDGCESNINSNSFMVLLSDGTIQIYTNVADNMCNYHLIGKTELQKIVNEIQENLSHTITHLLWLTRDIIVCITTCGKTSNCIVANLSFNGDSLVATVIKNFSMKEKIIEVARVPNTKNALLQTSSGKLVMYSDENIEDYHTSFPECCYQFEASVIEDEVYVFGITHRCRFYIGNKEVSNSVNSYFVHSDFLMLTTLQHQLLCCPLTKDNMCKFINKSFENKSLGENNLSISTRKLERGSRLVTVVSCDTRTILQLPRGNLEAIQPRSLSLKLIGGFLDSCRYHEAFDLMRKQRINLNLLYDHDPSKFLNHLDTFISQINSPSWLSLFVSELDNQDVTKTMYSSSYTHERQMESKKNDGKILLVCEKLRDALENHNELNKNLCPILTTYVKLNTTKDLQSALLKIKQVRQDTSTESVVSAEEALKYMLYLVNVNQLYDIALGLYDFELVMFVARKSQKDPKEYIPYLNELKSMDENYRWFSIDNYLKNFELALMHLINCGVDKQEELMSFIKQHTFYNLALRHLGEDDPRYFSCAEEFGNYLMARRYYAEAGVLFKRSRNLQKALSCFVEDMNWQAAVKLAEKLELPESEFNIIQTEIITKLKEAKRFEDAVAFIKYLDHLNVEEAMVCALEGRLYKLSLNMCENSKRHDLIEEKLLPEIIEQQSSLISTIELNRKQFYQQKERLCLVRQKKLEAAADENPEELHADCDLFSDTSSIMSSTGTKSSGRTFRSSKNRRKHERKLVSLREGSRFEDIALVRSLHTLVCGTFGLRQDVLEVNFVLQWLNKDDEVCELQSSLDTLLKDMTKYFCEIWIPELLTGSNRVPDANNSNAPAPDDSPGLPTLEPHIRIAPVIQDIKWKVELL